jgi:hypothetical protein
MEDDEKSDVVPGDFDRHPHGWSTSYPHANLRRPLVDYCTNEWKNNPQHGRADSPDREEEEDGFEICWRRTTAILRSRKIRRWFLCCSIFVFVSIHIYTTRIAPYLKENRRLVESLLLREQLASGKLSGGVFGHSVGADFPNVIQSRTLDAQYLPSAQAPRLPDPATARRLIFVGDIHGCKDDLVALLERVQFNKKVDHLVTTGDMISKGPDSLGTVDLLRSMGASCVRGKHEDYILLMAQSLNSTLLVQNGNHNVPLDFIADRPDDNLAAGLDSDQLAYLRSCPVILKIGSMKAFGGDIVVVHAGLVPGVPLERQDPSAVMNMRTIDLHSHVPSKDGQEGPGNDGSRKRPKSPFQTPTLQWPFNVHWIKLWNKYQSMLPAHRTLFPSKEKEVLMKKEQHMTVIYGHDSKRGLQIKPYTKGIDTGCVNGGKLTAFVIADGGVQYVKQVQCKSRYYIEKAND